MAAIHCIRTLVVVYTLNLGGSLCATACTTLQKLKSKNLGGGTGSRRSGMVRLASFACVDVLDTSIEYHDPCEHQYTAYTLQQ